MDNKEKMETIEKELLKVQLALKAPKDQKNDFGNYNYRNCEAILEAVKKVTSRAVTLEDELILIGDRYYLKATARFGVGADSITCSASARETLSKKGMDEAQITGAASSYARKYALCGLFAIDDSRNDPDSKDNRAIGQQGGKQSSNSLNKITADTKKVFDKATTIIKPVPTDSEFKDAIEALSSSKSAEEFNGLAEGLSAAFSFTEEQIKKLKDLRAKKGF